jgi:large subunit ribosomal protein L35
MKTRKTAAKRFKISGTGKLIRNRTRRNHLMINKDPNRKRLLTMDAVVTGGEALKIKRMLPYGV